jgi:hypothetical protein
MCQHVKIPDLPTQQKVLKSILQILANTSVLC